MEDVVYRVGAVRTRYIQEFMYVRYGMYVCTVLVLNVCMLLYRISGISTRVLPYVLSYSTSCMWGVQFAMFIFFILLGSNPLKQHLNFPRAVFTKYISPSASKKNNQRFSQLTICHVQCIHTSSVSVCALLCSVRYGVRAVHHQKNVRPSKTAQVTSDK